MELLQSVIMNSYPSLATLLKFWATQLINIAIYALITYPINVFICCFLSFILVYKTLDRFFGDKSFKAKYKPLEHKHNFLTDVKLVKK